MAGRLAGRTEQDSQRKKETPAICEAGRDPNHCPQSPGTCLAASLCNSSPAASHANRPAEPHAKKNTHTPIAEHKRALVMVNRARNVIPAGIKLVRDKGI